MYNKSSLDSRVEVNGPITTNSISIRYITRENNLALLSGMTGVYMRVHVNLVCCNLFSFYRHWAAYVIIVWPHNRSTENPEILRDIARILSH